MEITAIVRRGLGIAAALLVACALGALATSRGEAVNTAWVLVAAMGVYYVGYRFYSKFIAERVLGLDDRRATPAEVRDDGHDFVPTHKWVVYGHHFAAIAGPGPLIGPVLAAQLGYMPGLIWIVAGAILGGCVQDFVILFCSIRRDGRSLGQMAKDELGPVAGYAAMLGILAIMVILLAVIGLVVVRALDHSPWGTWTIACTIPIALIMGMYMRFWRPGKVEEASIIGFVLVVLAVVSGGWVAASPDLAQWFTLSSRSLAIAMILYGFAASTVPVWLLLAPRDYLSTFVKIGTVGALAVGILVVRPPISMPPITEFARNGMGPVWAGNLFPFCFITIACGAISGFHALISSGTTPKLISKESQARMVGYGGMVMESFVAVMALLAACSLSPGAYFAVNAPPAIVGKTPDAVVRTVSGWGYPVTEAEMAEMAQQVGEKSLYARTGGAPTLALGMSRIFGTVTGGRWMDLWYHFAIMFEALFILTTLDAGTRVGRFMLQDLLSHVWPPLGRVSWTPSVLLTSFLMVGGWGWFLWGGVNDPFGGINSLWPLFGIANQMLASLALVVATVILIKMGRRWLALVTGLPLFWLVLTTQVATWYKIYSPNPQLGTLKQIELLQNLLPTLADAAAMQTRTQIFNAWLQTGVAVMFAAIVWIVLIDAARVCISGKRPLQESPYVESRLTA